MNSTPFCKTGFKLERMAEKYRKSDLVMKEDDSDSDEVKMMQDLAPTAHCGKT